MLYLHCTALRHSMRTSTATAPAPRLQRQPADAILPPPRLASTAGIGRETLVAVRCQHGCTPARIAADNDMRCALFTLHLDCPCLPSAGASQAPRLMRCPVWRPLAALRWRCTCARLLPCRILLGAQLLSICSCFSIANSGPSLDPAAYSLPRRCDWHASLPIRS